MGQLTAETPCRCCHPLSKTLSCTCEQDCPVSRSVPEDKGTKSDLRACDRAMSGDCQDLCDKGKPHEYGAGCGGDFCERDKTMMSCVPVLDSLEVRAPAVSEWDHIKTPITDAPEDKGGE